MGLIVLESPFFKSQIYHGFEALNPPLQKSGCWRVLLDFSGFQQISSKASNDDGKCITENLPPRCFVAITSKVKISETSTKIFNFITVVVQS